MVEVYKVKVEVDGMMPHRVDLELRPSRSQILNQLVTHTIKTARVRREEETHLHPENLSF